MLFSQLTDRCTYVTLLAVKWEMGCRYVTNILRHPLLVVCFQSRESCYNFKLTVICDSYTKYNFYIIIIYLYFFLMII